MRKLHSVFAAVLLIAALTGCARADAKALFESSAAALEEGRAEEAREGFRQVISMREFEAEAYRAIGISYLGSADYADACIAFERALLYCDDKSADFIRDTELYLVFSRSRHAENDKAKEICNSMLKKAADPEVLFLRGRLFLEEGDETAAREDFDKAVALSSDYDLYISIYQLYNERKKDADGVGFLEKALEIAEQTEDAYYSRGLVYYYMQNYGEARSQLMEALEQSPDDPDALLLLGRIYLAMSDVADARALFRDHLDVNTAAACNGLALCDMAEGLYDSALENAEKGLEAADDSTRQALLFNEIVIYENLQEWAEARRLAAVYVSRYPSDEAGIRENEFLASR